MAKQLPLLKSLILKGVLYGQPSGFWLHVFLSSFFLNLLSNGKRFHNKETTDCLWDLTCRSRTAFGKNSFYFFFLKFFFSVLLLSQ